MNSNSFCIQYIHTDTQTTTRVHMEQPSPSWRTNLLSVPKAKPMAAASAIHRAHPSKPAAAAPAPARTAYAGINFEELFMAIQHPRIVKTLPTAICGDHDLPMDTWRGKQRAPSAGSSSSPSSAEEDGSTVLAIVIPQLHNPTNLLLLEHEVKTDYNRFYRNDVVLRSASVELRWVALFWMLNVPIFSEISITGAERRTPDFYLPSVQLLLEVKSRRPANAILQSYGRIAAALHALHPGIRVAVLWGQVRHGIDVSCVQQSGGEEGGGGGGGWGGGGRKGDTYKYPWDGGVQGIVWCNGVQVAGEVVMVINAAGDWDIDVVKVGEDALAWNTTMGRATHPDLLSALKKVGKIVQFTHTVPKEAVKPGCTWTATELRNLAT